MKPSVAPRPSGLPVHSRLLNPIQGYPSGLSFRSLPINSHQWAGFQFRVCKAFGCARPYQLPGFRAGPSCRDYQSLCRGPKSTSVLLSLCESLGFTGSLRRGPISNRLGLLQNHYRTSAPLLRSVVDLGT